jgi:hypothetical protein
MFTDVSVLQQQTFDQYRKKCKLSLDDPGLLFHWHDDAVAACVAHANANAAPAQPTWVSTLPGTMTASFLKQDTINSLALVGGGRFGSVFGAPNTLQQYTNVCTRLRDIEMDAYVQAHMAPAAAGAVLATMAQVTDRTTARGTPSARIAPFAPARLVVD